MTSCDKKMYPYVSVMLCSIADTLPTDIINFYILCDTDSLCDFDILEKVESFYSNLNIVVIPVYDSSDYNKFSHYGGEWNNAAYFTMCCQRYLPSKLDRILYIDAGDIMFVKDIEPFYKSNFNGKTILAAAPLRYKRGLQNSLFTFQSIDSYEELQGILKGQFNSGSYMINLKKMREVDRKLSDYDFIIDNLLDIYHDIYPSQVNRLYWGDQGLLSFMYLGDMEMFHSNLKILDMEYNFHLGIFNDTNIDYFPSKPSILHFCGVPKPWNIHYGDTHINGVIPTGKIPLADISSRITEYYQKWYEYAQIISSL